MNKDDQSKTTQYWKNVFALIKPKRLQAFIIATCTITIYITSLVFPLSLQKAIDAALTGDTPQFYWMLGLSITSSIIEIIFSNWRLITIINLGAYLELSLFGRLIKTILSRSYTKRQLSPGSILNTTNRISHIKDFVLHTAPQAVLELGQAMISLFIITSFSPTIAILITTTLIINAFFLKSFSSKLHQHLYEFNTQESQKQNTISSLALSLKNIKYHALESFIYKKILRHFKNSTNSLRALLGVSSRIQLWGSLTSRIITFVVLISGCISMKSNSITIGEFLIIQLLASRICTLFSSTSDLLSKYQEAKTALEKIELINNLPAEPNTIQTESKIETNNIFSLLNLHSQHSNGNTALKNISIELNGPGLIVFAGVSGSGKSTLVHTLMGLNRYSSGEIYYHGISLSLLNIRSLRKSISVTDQDNYVFSGTLRENLCCERNLTDEIIFHALDCVGLKTFIEATPEKLEYLIDDNGRNISGGQKQKICLGRALLRGSKYYILDEPTSSLDGEATLNIGKMLAVLSKTNLVICITHDPSLMAKASNIFLIDNGSITASGHHIELMKSCSDYKTIYTAAKKDVNS